MQNKVEATERQINKFARSIGISRAKKGRGHEDDSGSDDSGSDEEDDYSLADMSDDTDTQASMTDYKDDDTETEAGETDYDEEFEDD